jgi:phosphoribosyl 1,2-cyclic phosphodiesterase
LRYGGNTTCIEVRTDEGHLIILDAGTGIFPLAQQLLKSMPVQANIFMTHSHWDHIQGLPFFTPLYIPGQQGSHPRWLRHRVAAWHRAGHGGAAAVQFLPGARSRDEGQYRLPQRERW